MDTDEDARLCWRSSEIRNGIACDLQALFDRMGIAGHTGAGRISIDFLPDGIQTTVMPDLAGLVRANRSFEVLRPSRLFVNAP
jgi:hypothetical protein